MNQLTHSNTAPCSAFFDVDDTVIAVKSMLSFQDLWYSRHHDPLAEQRYRDDLAGIKKDNACWATLNRKYYSHFAGRSVDEVKSLAYEWYLLQSKDKRFYHSHVISLLRQHQSLGHTCVFVSGSFQELLEPIAKELNVEHVLAIELETDNGRYTGRIIPPQTIGEGKVLAIEEFLAQHLICASNCYAYGDDISDFPMLEYVGKPNVIAGGRSLEEKARRLGWPIILPY
ncbi:HAD family hydrolase [Gilvimarinus chinensis]|uniref:HAD family hydrolase n=1 Tax=Gilvimarinus chinensis TaxID=396005 RepID=UPI00035C1F87|nr:HAD family hydrolase [Gilvimarinus chinensis]